MITRTKLLILFVISFVSVVTVVHSRSSQSNEINNNTRDKLSPVIFIPGDGGNQLDAQLNKTSSVHVYCQKHADWFNIWLNLELLVPLIIGCWIDNVKLQYDNITRTTHNTPGVKIRIPGWGDPEVVEWIDPTKAKTGGYFKDIGDQLVRLGYERKKSIFGAPYDFRKAPNENAAWFVNLKQLVEDAYDMNDQTPITFITHSMGSPMTLVFLQRQTQQWKSKYVARVVSIAGAWAGSAKAVKVYAMGDDLDSFALSGKVMREQQISTPSTAFLLPSPLFWKNNEVLVEAPSRTYSVAQLEDFFNDIDYRDGWEMRKDNIKYSLNFAPPDVEMHCLYGSGVPTVEKLVYKKDNLVGETPTLVKGDGDGTVNSRSLKACMYWKDYQRPSITMYDVPKADHMSILADPRVIEYIRKLL
ncbi:phospholipase A2 group XV-like [Episyrphus balteatus]|uniref:phospholipase A2 group XV-like n=1 Tax=Episyrphus balteatus TaxID=286459 RepID=UPI002486B44A|nr:phospholipase A2 group XV-like [Episyrphus balteatus]